MMAYCSTIRRETLSRKIFHHHTDLFSSTWPHKELVPMCMAMSSARLVLTNFVISFHRLLLSHQQLLEQTHPQVTPGSILVLPLDYVEADFNLMRSWHSMTWFLVSVVKQTASVAFGAFVVKSCLLHVGLFKTSPLFDKISL